MYKHKKVFHHSEIMNFNIILCKNIKNTEQIFVFIKRKFIYIDKNPFDIEQKYKLHQAFNLHPLNVNPEIDTEKNI